LTSEFQWQWTSGRSLSSGSCTATSLFQQGQSRDPEAAGNNENDDDEDDDEFESDTTEANLEDWRKFRASLIAKEAAEGKGVDGRSTNSDGGKKQAATMSQKSVAPQNQALLATQNKRLAEEYQTSVWAHSISQPEIGGLLVRMPLEAELYYGKESSNNYWHEKLQLMMQLEEAPSPKGDGNNDDDDHVKSQVEQ
jgi:hypothetical protein